MSQVSIEMKDLSEILEQVSGKTFSNLREQDFLVKDLELASIEIVDFIFELERKFQIGIKIGDFYQETESSTGYQRDFQIKDVFEVIKKK